MSTFKDKNVLITGGASGIGKIMGRIALEKGCKNLIIWDINEANISATISELSNYKNIKGYKVDVSDENEVNTIQKQVKADVGVVDILINNAGIVVGKLFSDHSTNDIKKTMNINAI